MDRFPAPLPPVLTLKYLLKILKSGKSVLPGFQFLYIENSMYSEETWIKQKKEHSNLAMGTELLIR